MIVVIEWYIKRIDEVIGFLGCLCVLKYICLEDFEWISLEREVLK